MVGGETDGKVWGEFTEKKEMGRVMGSPTFCETNSH